MKIIKKSIIAQNIIARFGFTISVATYMLLLISDSLRSGFVARYFSPHIFLLLAIIFGLWWLRVQDNPKSCRICFAIFVLCFAFALPVIVWNLGSGFGSYRLLVSIIAFFVPFIVNSNLGSMR